MSGRLILVWGGSGSGKSAWAERRLLSQNGRAPVRPQDKPTKTA